MGGGDPCISGRFFDGNPTAVIERWADEIRAGGIRTISGKILVVHQLDQGGHNVPHGAKATSLLAIAEHDEGLVAQDECLALADRLVQLKWVRRMPDSRAVVITRKGKEDLKNVLGLSL